AHEQLFVAALKGSNPRVREQAAIGIGRIGKPKLATALVPLTADADGMVRHAAQQSLRRLNAWQACVAVLSPGTDQGTVAGALRTLRGIYEPRPVSAIASYLTSVQRRAGADRSAQSRPGSP